MLVAVALLSLMLHAAPVCTVGSGASAWTGSPADLAMIEARYQRDQAEGDRRAYPQGAPEASPWSAFVRCSGPASS